MSKLEFAEYFDTRMDEDGRIVAILVFKVGGGTVGESYDGYWDAAISYRGETEWQTGETFSEKIYTGTPKTHEEIVDLAMDFYTNGGPF